MEGCGRKKKVGWWDETLKAKSEGATQRPTVSSGVAQEEKIGDQDMEGPARTVLSCLL